jgi:hypothetical protein
MKTKQTPAQKERAEQIANARACYLKGEITLADYLWYCVLTLKYVLGLAR